MIYLSQFLCIWRPLKISPLKGENTRPGHSSNNSAKFHDNRLHRHRVMCNRGQKRNAWWVKVIGHADKEVEDELMMQT